MQMSRVGKRTGMQAILTRAPRIRGDGDGRALDKKTEKI